MREWLSSNPIGAVVAVIVAVTLLALRFVGERDRLKNLPLLWRPSGTPASLVVRAVLGLGLVAGVVGFIYSVRAVPPRWANPLLWTGFGATMAAGLAAGFTARTDDLRSHEHERTEHRDRVT